MSDAPGPTSELAADVLDATRSALVAALNDARPSPDWAWDILNRWDALVARVTDLEAAVLRESLRAVAAEAQVAALTQERDLLLRNIQNEAVQTIQAKEFGSAQFARAEAAEAALATTRRELRSAENAVARASLPDALYYVRRAVAATEEQT